MDIREQIEMYALGKLTGSELAAFEARRSSDPDFALEVTREMELLDAIRLAPEVQALRAKLQLLEQELPVAPVRKVSFLRLFAVAAAICLLVAAVWFIGRPHENTSQELFAAYFHPPEMVTASKGVNVEKKDSITPFFTLWEEAEREYNLGNFQGAIVKLARLQEMPDAMNFSDDLAYLNGMACLQNRQPQEAIIAFKKIKYSFPSEKNWYLALSYLYADQIASAKKEFSEIAASSSPFSKNARAILIQLN